MKEIYLKEIAHGRSGDKGDTSNVCVYARKAEYFPVIKEQVTEKKVKDYFGNMVKGEIIRYEVDSLKGFNFVMKHALGGGATHSLRLDSLGNSLGSAFMRMKIQVDDDFGKDERAGRKTLSTSLMSAAKAEDGSKNE